MKSIFDRCSAGLNTQVRISLISCALIAGVPTAQAGDAAAGEAKATTCAACHGAQGVSEIPANPTLAGQYESYLVQALTAYNSGTRQNAIMQGMAAALSPEDIADLAAYYASQPSSLHTAGSP